MNRLITSNVWDWVGEVAAAVSSAEMSVGTAESTRSHRCWTCVDHHEWVGEWEPLRPCRSSSSAGCPAMSRMSSSASRRYCSEAAAADSHSCCCVAVPVVVVASVVRGRIVVASASSYPTPSCTSWPFESSATPDHTVSDGIAVLLPVEPSDSPVQQLISFFRRWLAASPRRIAALRRRIASDRLRRSPPSHLTAASDEWCHRLTWKRGRRWL